MPSNKSGGWSEMLKFLGSSLRYDQTELRLWRKYYPHRAIYISEEARAEVENREPDYPPPIAIG